MGQLLKFAGGLALSYFMFGGRIIGAIYDRIEYQFDRINIGNIRLDITQGNLVGRIRMNMTFKQSLGLNLSASQLQLTLSQQGALLGRVTVNDPVVLPHDTVVNIPFNVVVPAGPFLTRIEDLLSKPQQAKWYAPIDVKGYVMLSNGQQVPVGAQMKFFST